MTEWTEDMIRDLRICWAAEDADGKPRYSTAVLGLRFGVTKNAIVGKAHRLDLDRRQSPIRTGEGYRAPSSGPRIPPPPEPLPPLLSASPLLPLAADTAIVSWRAQPTPSARLRPSPSRLQPQAVISAPRPQSPPGRISECVYPIGTPGKPGFRFCAGESAPGKPYCAEHWRATHQKASQTEDA